MKKPISKIEQVRALMPADSKFQLKTVSTSTGEQDCFETGDWDHNIWLFIRAINEALGSSMVMITEQFEWKDDDRKTWSYYFKIISISDLELPAYFTTSTGGMTIAVPSLEDWKIIRIDNSPALCVSQMPIYSLEKYLRTGILMPTTDEVFKKTLDEAVSEFRMNVKSLAHEAA